MSLDEFSKRDLEMELMHRSVEEKVKKLPAFLQGKVVRDEMEHFIIFDLVAEIPTHQLSASRNCGYFRPIVNGESPHMLILGEPDHSADNISEDYLTEVYVCDHAKIFIKGAKKDRMTILIEDDEFPVDIIVKLYNKETKVTVDDSYFTTNHDKEVGQ